MIGNAPSFGSTIGLLQANLISPIQENLFVAGFSFSFEDYFVFAADETKTIVFNPTNFTGENLTINPFSFNATAGPVEIDIYAGTTSNEDGTVLVPSNRRSGFPAPVSTLRLNPTGVTLGTRFSGDLIPGTGNNPSNSIPSSNMPGLPFELNPAIKYALTMHNSNGADTKVQMKMTWFEV